jgi:hypothetical protein
MVLSPIASFRRVKAGSGARFLLSLCFLIENFADSAELEAVSRAKIIVNPQTLITTHHALLLVISSCFVAFSSSAFFPFLVFFENFANLG